MVSDNDDADLAVLIIGLIASDKFKLLSAGLVILGSFSGNFADLQDMPLLVP